MKHALISVSQAALYLGLSTKTLARWRWKGGGPPFVKLGSGSTCKVCYRESDLDAWIESRVKTSTSAK